MKFCQICGRPLNDGEVCNCQAQQQAAPQQPAQQPYYQQQYAAPQQQYAAPQQPYGAPQQPYGAPQQPYGQPMPPRPAGDGKFVKALKNIPVAFKSYFKNSDKVIGTAKAKKDTLLPLLYAAIFFLANLILGISFFARGTSYSTSNGSYYFEGLGDLQGTFLKNFKGFNYFNFGFVLLSALIMTVVVCVLYVGARFAAQAIFARKAPAQALVDSFIEFGFHLIPVSCLLVAAALLGLATCWLVVPLMGLAASYLIVVGVTATVKEAADYPNKLLLTIFMTICVMLTVALSFWMLRLMCGMNFS